MIVLGHRGSPGKDRTENTLESFDEAIRQGADGIECDARLSKDDEIVVVHDANLHRIAGDAHRVAELTATELAAISLRFGGTIPTLQDLTSRYHAPLVLDIEIKHHDVLPHLILKLKTSATLRGRTVVSSFHLKIIQHIRRELPDVRTILLLKNWPLPLRGNALWQRVQHEGIWGIGLSLAMLNPRRVQILRSRNIHVAGWDQRTIGTPAEARRAQKLGLDVAIVRCVWDAKRQTLDSRSKRIYDATPV